MPTPKKILVARHSARPVFSLIIITYIIHLWCYSMGQNNSLVDMMGVPFGWTKGEGNWTVVNAVVARGELVEVIQEVGSTLWQKYLPVGHSFYFEVEENETKISEAEPRKSRSQAEPGNELKARIWISFTSRRFSPLSELPKVQWHPRVLWVGIGCISGISRQLIEMAIERVFQANHLAMGAIAGIATIDTKALEPGLVELCDRKNWPLQTFPADILNAVPVPTPSAVVAASVGTNSVAEAAALGASDSQNLLVRKQIFGLDTEGKLIQNKSGSVTVAVALALREYSDRTGL